MKEIAYKKIFDEIEKNKLQIDNLFLETINSDEKIELKIINNAYYAKNLQYHLNTFKE